MRPIDADAALRRFDNDLETMKTKIEGKVPFQVGAAMVSAAKEIRVSLKETLDGTPTIDYAPAVHGEWKYFHKQNIAVCTVCSFERDLDADFGRAVSCPNCGANMDGGK